MLYLTRCFSFLKKNNLNAIPLLRGGVYCAQGLRPVSEPSDSAFTLAQNAVLGSKDGIARAALLFSP